MPDSCHTSGSVLDPFPYLLTVYPVKSISRFVGLYISIALLFAGPSTYSEINKSEQSFWAPNKREEQDVINSKKFFVLLFLIFVLSYKNLA